jgi:hypothetical protein
MYVVGSLLYYIIHIQVLRENCNGFHFHIFYHNVIYPMIP